MHHFIKLLFTVAAHIGLSGFSHASLVTAHFTSAATVPVTAATYTATGNTIELSLGFAPATGTNLTVVRNTGLSFINGTFSNLAQGQAVSLLFGGVVYNYVANYYSGNGNDLVLQWADSRLMGWGQGGLVGDDSLTLRNSPVDVTSTGALAGKTVISVASGRSHSLALCSDGTVVAWGGNTNGQLGDNSTTQQITPVAVTSTGALAGKTVVKVAAGGSHSLALCSDGTLVAWGFNSTGQLGDSSTTMRDTPVAVRSTGALAGKTVISVAAGISHSLALCSDGTLVAWGWNGYGQLGDNSTTQQNSPVAVTGNGALSGKSVISIAAGEGHSLAICSDGTLVAWGRNSNGQLGDNSTTQRNTPVAVTASGALAGKTIVKAAAGGYHNLALCSDGTLVAWGSNGYGQLGDDSTTHRNTPLVITGNGALSEKSVVSITAGEHHSFAICSDGSLVGWGRNDRAQLGDNSRTQRNSPIAVGASGALADKTVAYVAGGSNHSLALVASPPRDAQLPLPSVSAGGAHSLFLSSNGSVWASGNNEYGQLGDGTLTNRNSPNQIPNLTGVRAIAAGGGHSLFLKIDGTVWATGDNRSGQLGIGSSQSQPNPVKINALTNIIAIAAGGSHSVFVKNDGTAWVAGRNVVKAPDSELLTFSQNPVQVPNLSGIISASAGASHTAFLRNDGSVWTYGSNHNGQLGRGNLGEDQPIPGMVSNLSNIKKIEAGAGYTLFIDEIADVWGVGNNFAFRGDQALADLVTPIRIAAASPSELVSAGWDHYIYTRGFNTYASGGNIEGQLGNNTISNSSYGVTVLNLVRPQSISGGSTFSLFMNFNGIVFSTGSNWAGQLGDGSNSNRRTSVEITLPNVGMADHIITFSAPETWNLRDGNNTTLSSESERGLPFSYSVVSGPATSSGSKLTFTGPGTVIVRVSYPGNFVYLPKTEERTILVSQSSQTINFAALTDRFLKDGTTVSLNATSSSGLPINYNVVSGPATLTSQTLNLTGPGIVTVRASQPGNFAYTAATPVERSFTVSQSSQEITFAALPDRFLKDGTTVTLSASTPSSLPITFSVVSGPATLSGSTLNLSGPGTVTVRASQPGNFAYLAATPVERSFTVSQSSQAITFAALADRFLKDGTTLSLTASTPSGLPITFTLVSGPATLSGSTLTLTGTGTVTVRASQAGNFAYTAATPVERSFTVSQSSQEITFPALSDRLFRSGLTIPLQATSSSGLAVSYSIVSGPGSLTGSNLVIQSAGTIVVRASQTGNFAYLPAPPVERTVVITPNTAPANLTLSRNWFYDNTPNGTEIGTFSVTDPDVGDVISYSFVTGTGSTDNAKFSLSGNSLRKASTAFNYNTQRTASIRVRATDLAGQFHEQAITLNLVAGSPNARFIAAGDSFTQAPSYVNAVFQLVNKSTERGINYPRALFDPSSPDYQPDLFQIFEAATIGGTVSRITPNESFFQVGKISDVPSKVRTIILLDNSSSISIADLGVIRAAAKVMVDNMFDEQEIAIYTFSGTHTLVQGFLGESPANQAQLKAAIDTIGRGSATTNLYGSMLAMLNVPEWTESFSTAGINTGFLVALTDGADSSGSATKEQVIAKRNLDGKKIYTIGLGANVDPMILQELQNTNFYTSATNASVLAAAFENIQKDIIDLANSYYRINYISPKRLSNPPGTLRKMEVWLKNNTNTALDNKLSTAFNSDAFTDLEPTMYLNRTLDKLNGINPPEALVIDANAPSSASAITIFPPLDFSSFTWSIGNSNLATLMPQGVNGERVIITPNGQNGTTTLTLTDTISNADVNFTDGRFTKTIQLIIGTGVTLPPQTITFPTIADRVPTSPAFSISASASSLLPVSFTLVSGPATVSGNSVTLIGTAGTVTIRASQAGNASFATAPPETRSFTVADSSVLLAGAMQGSGLTGDNALPNATPFNDGVENLLKYAFNMNLAGPDASTLPPGTGTSGLPAITTPQNAPAGTLRFEFLRRKGSGLVYAPRKSTTLDGATWSPLAAAPVVTTINDQWERVVYTEAPDPVPAPVCFGRVEVTIP